jgi:hypothetical protein
LFDDLWYFLFNCWDFHDCGSVFVEDVHSELFLKEVIGAHFSDHKLDAFLEERTWEIEVVEVVLFAAGLHEAVPYFHGCSFEVGEVGAGILLVS